MNGEIYTAVLLNANNTVAGIANAIVDDGDTMNAKMVAVFVEARFPNHKAGQLYHVYRGTDAGVAGLHATGTFCSDGIVFEVKIEEAMDLRGTLRLFYSVELSGPTDRLIDGNHNVIPINSIDPNQIVFVGMVNDVVTVPDHDAGSNARYKVAREQALAVIPDILDEYHNTDSWRASLDGKTAYFKLDTVVDVGK